MANPVQAMSSNGPFGTSVHGNFPAAPPNSPNMNMELMAPAPDVSIFESDEVFYEEFGF